MKKIIPKSILLNALLLLVTFTHAQSKILVVLAHPNLEESEVNRHIANKLELLDRVTIDDLYAKYRDFRIDIGAEQQLILNHDIIIFQFPLYWFSSPALLKKWQDEVITSEFSIGENNQLKGKQLLLVVSAGGTEQDYRHGSSMDITMDEVLAPFESFARFTEMIYLPPFITFGVPNPKILNIPLSHEQRNEREEYIKLQGDRLVQLIKTIE